MTNIRRQVERSSLGTREAAAARRTITTSAAARVVARSVQISKTTPAARLKPGR